MLGSGEKLMRVRFTRSFNWTDPRLPMRTTAYKAGWAGQVTTPCADAAIAAGAAVKATRNLADDKRIEPAATADVPETNVDE